MKKTTISGAALAVLLGMTAAACGGNDSSSSAASSSSKPASSASGASSSSSAPAAEEDHSVAIPKIVGAADSSKPTIKIGVINMNEGTPSYPDIKRGVDIAVEFINAELGGFKGHPIAAEHCTVGMDQATNQECAQKFANDSSINVVMNGYVFGSGFVHPILEAANLPVLLQTPLTAPDFQAKNAWGFQGGNAGGTAGTAAYSVKVLGAKKIVGIGADNDATRAAVKTIEDLPSMAGVDFSVTYVSETAADITAEVQVSGADSADTVLAIVNTPQCVLLAQTLKDLDIKAQAISTTTCAVPTTLAQNPGLFEGWHIVGSALPPLLAEGESAELDFYREIYPKYGEEQYMNSFHTLGGFSAFLALHTIAQDLPDTPTRDDWKAGLSGFTGPYFGGKVELSCPGKHFPAVCNNEIRAFELNDKGVMKQVQGFFDGLS